MTHYRDAVQSSSITAQQQVPIVPVSVTTSYLYVYPHRIASRKLFTHLHPIHFIKLIGQIEVKMVDTLPGYKRGEIPRFPFPCVKISIFYSAPFHTSWPVGQLEWTRRAHTNVTYKYIPGGIFYIEDVIIMFHVQYAMPIHTQCYRTMSPHYCRHLVCLFRPINVKQWPPTSTVRPFLLWL